MIVSVCICEYVGDRVGKGSELQGNGKGKTGWMDGWDSFGSRRKDGRKRGRNMKGKGGKGRVGLGMWMVMGQRYICVRRDG